jgi:hypothetical protein
VSIILPRPFYLDVDLVAASATKFYPRAMPTDSSKHWRRLEAETRLLVLSMGNPKAKRAMLSVADAYASLAMRTDALRAEKLISGISFGPEALKTIGAAFDSAWEDIADHFRSEPVAKEEARQKLAIALFSIASEDSRSVEPLKRAALQRMALDYRRRRPGI